MGLNIPVVNYYKKLKECTDRFDSDGRRILAFLKQQLSNCTGIDIAIGSVQTNKDDPLFQYRRIVVLDSIHGRCTLLQLSNQGEMKLFRYDIGHSKDQWKTAEDLVRSRFLNDTQPLSQESEVVTAHILEKGVRKLFRISEPLVRAE